MAIRILKHGTKKVVECENCGCLFEFEKEDTVTEQIKYNEYVQYVKCPDCKCKIETHLN